MTEDMLTRCCSSLDDILTLGSKGEWESTARALKPFLECFFALSPEDQNAIRTLLTDTEARTIASLSVPAAAYAISERNVEWLHWSLLAHDVEQFREDPRNNLRLLAVTNYAAEQIGADPTEIFERAASVMSERSATYVREFARRPRDLRTLRSMGVRATSEAGRPRFEFL